jgi:hypothetical protein
MSRFVLFCFLMRRMLAIYCWFTELCDVVAYMCNPAIPVHTLWSCDSGNRGRVWNPASGSESEVARASRRRVPRSSHLCACFSER